MRVIFHPQARTEQLEAIEWYRQKEGDALGRRFRAGIIACIEEFASQPSLFPQTLGGCRRAPVTKFPYQVIFKVRPGLIEVLALAHNRRRPGYWLHRI